MNMMNQLDQLADALRLKDAEQRGSKPLDWKYLTQIDRTKWRELALVATVNLAKADMA